MLEQKNQRVQRLQTELEEARRELREAILTAHESGETVAEIARRLGVTRARVYQQMR